MASFYTSCTMLGEIFRVYQVAFPLSENWVLGLKLYQTVPGIPKKRRRLCYLFLDSSQR